MTVEQFNQQLSQFGEQYIVSDSNSFWDQAMDRVVEDLRVLGMTSKPTENISMHSEGDSVFLEIRDYLVFQNYGVKGLTNKTRQYGVPTEIGLNPLGSGRQYQFGVQPSGKHYWGIHYPGINAKYDFDINTGNYNITENYFRYLEVIQQQQSNL